MLRRRVSSLHPIVEESGECLRAVSDRFELKVLNQAGIPLGPEPLSTTRFTVRSQEKPDIPRMDYSRVRPER